MTSYQYKICVWWGQRQCVVHVRDSLEHFAQPHEMPWCWMERESHTSRICESISLTRLVNSKT